LNLTKKTQNYTLSEINTKKKQKHGDLNGVQISILDFSNNNAETKTSKKTQLWWLYKKKSRSVTRITCKGAALERCRDMYGEDFFRRATF